MRKKFSLFLVVLMLLSVFSPLGLEINDNKVAINTNVVEAAGDYSEEPDFFKYNETKWFYVDSGQDPGKENDRYSWTKGDFKEGTELKETTKSDFSAKRGELSPKEHYNEGVLLKQYKENKEDIEAYFFLHKLETEKPQEGKAAIFNIEYDDAAIVYLNGNVVFEGSVPEGGYPTNLSYGGSNQGDPIREEVTITPKQLQEFWNNNGDNYIAVEIHQGRATSSDIFFAAYDGYFKELPPEPEAGSIQTNAILTIGKDPSERNFTWYSNTTVPGKFEFKEANVDKDFTGATVLNANVIEKVNKEGFSSNSVTLEGLKPNTEYMYRYSNGETVSEVVNFKTQGTEDFSFFIAGDPQIGSGGYLNGKEGWDKTLKLLPSIDPNASFLLSLGDQVNTSSDEEQYDEYINREGFKGLTLATVVGNHDSGNRAYTEHFKLSNVQEEGKTTAGSNYYYVYNNTLFICLNSNNRDYAEHKSTIKRAIAENPNVKWKVVAFHHPPYTVASHALDGYISNMRSTLVPIFKENKIDLVLNGHDHVYTRTHVMDGTKPIIEWENGEEGKAPSEYVNPKGIIYVTTNSASGSKHYDIMKNQNFKFSAFKNQEYVPNISNLKITDNSIEVTTYRTNDSVVVDSFKIIKEDPTPVKPSEVRVTFKVDENKGKFLPNEDGVILNTRVLPMNFDATKLEKMAPEVEGLDGYEFKGWDKEFVGELDQDLTINAIFEKVEKTEPEEDNSVEPTKPTPTQPEKDDTREEPIRLFPRHHDRTETHPVYVSKSSIFTKEDALKKGKEIANKNLAKNSGKATDIDGHWAKDSINYALENNLIDLIGNEFKPNKNATRYTVVKALGRFKKIDVEKYKGKSLKDVDANSEESAYVNWAIENGIIAGYEDNTFGGDREITREEIARILNLFAEKFDIKVKNLEAPKFKDQNKVSDWASKDVKEATEKGLLVGRDDGTFGPKDNLTRAEVAQMIVNMIK